MTLPAVHDIQYPMHTFDPSLLTNCFREQSAVPLAIVLIVGSVLLRWIRPSPKRKEANALLSGTRCLVHYEEPNSPKRKEVDALRLQLFCILSLLAFSLLMASQSNLVWILRYLIPALPLIYVLLSMWVPPLNFTSRLASKLGGLNTSCVILFGVMFVECLTVAPFHFSYISPLVGGSYRVPIALNDSNVDYGQDLFYIERWAKRFRGEETAEPNHQLFGILSGHGRIWLKELCPPATPTMVYSALIRAQQRLEGTAASLKSWSSRGG